MLPHLLLGALDLLVLTAPFPSSFRSSSSSSSDSELSSAISSSSSFYSLSDLKKSALFSNLKASFGLESAYVSKLNSSSSSSSSDNSLSLSEGDS